MNEDKIVLIKSFCGQVTDSRESSKLHLFTAPKNADVKSKLITASGTDLDRDGVYVSKSDYVPAKVGSTSSNEKAMYGSCFNNDYTFKDEEVFMVYINHRKPYGQRDNKGWIFLKADSYAPYRLIKFTAHTPSRDFIEEYWIEGRLKIMNESELSAEGVVVKPYMQMYLSPSMVSSIIKSDNIMLEEKVRPVPQGTTILSEDGEKLFFPKKRRGRIF